MGTILVWPIAFAPKGWAFCAGQAVSINENQTLFALLGTTYGGNGTTNFMLPDLRSRVPAGSGSSPGIQYPFEFGRMGGRELNTLTVDQCPAHVHANTIVSGTSTVTASVAIPVSTDVGNKNEPTNSRVLATAKTTNASVIPKVYSNKTTDRTTLAPFTSEITITPSASLENVDTGNSANIENRQPYTAVNYIIAIEGLFPPRN